MEMIIDETLVFSDIAMEHYLHMDEIVKHLVICQIGSLGHCLEGMQVVVVGFDEVNLNAVCLSTRVMEWHELGAVLMKNIDAAMELLQTMCDAMAAAAVDGSTGTAMPISIKVCIAIDDCDVEEFLESSEGAFM